MKNIIAAVFTTAGLLAVSAQAQTIAWNTSDPAAAVADRFKQPMHLPGEPFGGNQIDFRFEAAPRVQLSLIADEPKNLIEIRADVCADEPPGEQLGDANPCDEMLFVLPALSYDKAAKKVYKGNLLIAQYRGIFTNPIAPLQTGLRLEKGYRLNYEISESTVNVWLSAKK